MRLRTLQRRHFRELLALEVKASKSLARALDGAVSHLEQKLSQLPDDALLADHRSQAEQAAKAALAVLSRKGQMAMAVEAAGAIAVGVQQELAEIALQEARWGKTDRAKAIADLNVPLPTATAVQRKSLYNPFRAVFEELKERLFLDAVSGAMESAIAAGENLKDATKRLVGKLKGETWQLTRIARTEIGNAMNQGHAAAINEVAERYPAMGIKQQWSSHFDAVMSAICRALHGQVRAAGAVFQALGREVARPPALPNCRSRLVAWAAHWGDAVQPRTEAETQAEEDAWQASRQAEREARRAARRKGKKGDRRVPANADRGVPADFKHHFHQLGGVDRACCHDHH
jgi:hypothetical protein